MQKRNTKTYNHKIIKMRSRSTSPGANNKGRRARLRRQFSKLFGKLLSKHAFSLKNSGADFVIGDSVATAEDIRKKAKVGEKVCVKSNLYMFLMGLGENAKVEDFCAPYFIVVLFSLNLSANQSASEKFKKLTRDFLIKEHFVHYL